ncbi:hypothetical protein COLO4_27058 [Corchorus olitorius]|uniref:Legume lectin domain-containing protein n=1 Tax=Corchorus olitorius TaxID=93759 RepID=A0A1R3HTD9_9ROSI|nr:hypothetical protein COLO4_27058 [Corchorus olitorius]
MLPFSYKITVIFLALFFLCFALNSNETIATTEFDFGTLTLSSLKLLGDAHLNNGSVRLTRDLQVPNSGSGRVLYSKPVRFRQPGTHYPCSFSTFFSFSVTNLNPDSIGGGLAFVISPDGDFLGAAGGSLGLLDDKGQALGFVAVEFDTLMDVEFKDINGNHVGLDLNSVVSSQVGDLGTLDIDLKSGNLVNSWIEYDSSFGVLNISVSYSNLKPKQPMLSLPLNLDQYVNDFMYVGFSGSTQGSTEVHSIEWWSFSSSFESNSGSSSSPPPPTASLMNPTANSVKSPPPSIAPSSVSTSSTQQKSSKSSSSCHNQLCKEGPGAVVGVVTAGAFFLALFAGALIWVYSKKFKHVKKSENNFASEIIKMPKEFSYKELKAATRCFNANRIIEVASGRRPIERDVNAGNKVGVSGNLVEWVWSLHRDGRLLAAADARLEGQFDEGEMRKVLLVGLACSHPDPLARPTMRCVVQMLVGEAEVPIVPRAKPSMSFSTSHLLLSLQDSFSDCNGMITISSSSSSDNSYIGPDLV